MNENEVNAIERIITDKQIIEVGGITYSRNHYSVVEPYVKRPDTVGFNTLISMVEFAKNNKIDYPKEENAGYFAMIDSSLSVSFHTGIHSEDMKRTCVATAVNLFERFPFDRFMPSEVFNIQLQTRFVFDKAEAKNLFSILSKLQIDEGIILSDDGMTTKVTVKRGMSAASIDSETMKTRVLLAPYRIFPECDQPASEFLVRIKGSKEEGANVGLWETDGGMWQIQAKQIIASKLRECGLQMPIYA